MKIAFLCLNLVDAIRRAEAFIKNSQDHSFTIVLVREWHDKESRPPRAYSIPYQNVDYIEDRDFDPDVFDLVLVNNDKAFKMLIKEVYNGKLVDLSDKSVFQEKLLEFGGFDLIPTNVEGYTFADDEIVFAKPRNSSGGYSELDICYNPRKYSEVKHLDQDKFIIQKYFDSPQILLLSFVNNGEHLVLYDVVEQEFMQSENKNVFTSYIKSDLYLREQFDGLVQKLRGFFAFCNFQAFKGFFGVQFLIYNGKFYPIDCNLRTGPLAMEIELRDLLDTRMYKSIPFFFGDQACKEYLENPSNYESYTCYAEKDGKLTTSRQFIPNFEERIQIFGNKTSGTFRSDYEMFIEKSNSLFTPSKS